MLVKRQNARSKSGKCGGNKKPQSFKTCEECEKEFGPVSHLARRFCSPVCKVAAQSTGRKVARKTITKARSAQSLLAYHIKAGNVVRPLKCDECRASGKIEGAHFDYARPLDVRWLCRSCHVKWDKAAPKNATYRVSPAKQGTKQDAAHA